MCSLLEIELFLGRCTDEKSTLKPMNALRRSYTTDHPVSLTHFYFTHLLHTHASISHNDQDHLAIHSASLS